jgi:hypothetical protein
MYTPLKEREMTTLKPVLNTPRAHQALTAVKAVILVAAIWGLAYPLLLWGMKLLVPAA